MKSALWLLLWLQLRGWIRYLGRSLRTVKGGILAAVGLFAFAMFLLPSLLLPSTPSSIDPEVLRRTGPLLLIAYCLMDVLVSGGERAVYFSPAEVQFLFPGPFTRRQLLLFRIVFKLLAALPQSLLFLILLRAPSSRWPSAYIGLLLILSFTLIFSLIVNMTATSIGARLYSRGKWLIAMLLVAAGAGYYFLSTRVGLPTADRLLRFANDPPPTWIVLTTPLRWYFDAFFAPRIWPDLALYGSLALLVNCMLLAIALSIDVDFLETASASSARIFSQLQRFRRGDLSTVGKGKARFSLPDFPYLGGIGPVLWRQLTTAARGLGRLALILVIVSAFVLGPLLMQRDEMTTESLAPVLGGMICWLTLFLTQVVPFDFRGDLDRMATLKALPLPAWRLVIGQLLAPSLVLALTQWVMLFALQWFADMPWLITLSMCAYTVPFNFLLFAMENLLFLYFPTRLAATSPGDFQAMGRNLLFAFAKFATLVAVMATTALTGVLMYLLTWAFLEAGTASATFAVSGSTLTLAPYIVAVFSGWLMLAGSGLALVPLVTQAFQFFDMGRDTPP